MLRTLILMLAVVATTAGASDVYRSVGPNGTVIYSDVPIGADAKAIRIVAAEPATQAANAAGTAHAGTTAAAKPAGGAAAEAGAQAASNPTPADVAKEKAANCKAAQGRAERYSAAHRLYRKLANGEREYLSDAEIDKARAQATADVDHWCN